MILKMRMMVMMIFLYGDDGVDQDDTTNLPLPREPWLELGSSLLVPAPPLHLLNLQVLQGFTKTYAAVRCSNQAKYIWF